MASWYCSSLTGSEEEEEAKRKEGEDHRIDEIEKKNKEMIKL